MSLLFLTFLAFLAFLTNSQDPYTQGNGTRNLYYAYGAYCPASQLQTWTCKWCKYLPNFEISDVYENDHLLAFTGYDHDYSQIIVSFRGTHNIYDWLDDLDFIQIPYPGVTNGYVHKGFYDSWKNVLYPNIFNNTLNLIKKYPNKRILVTGHSLGASVAQIAMLDIINYINDNKLNNEVLSYNYGSPRWGNDVLINYFQSLISTNWRVVNEHDVVPTLPYQIMGKYNYHHSHIEIWYTNDTTNPLTYQQCDGSGEDPNCAYFGYSVEDHLHYMGIYETCSS